MSRRLNIVSRVKQTIVRALELQVDPEDIADDEVLFGEGLGLDSTATLEIVFALEEEFSIEVDDDDLQVELFSSVSSLVEYVETRLREKVMAHSA